MPKRLSDQGEEMQAPGSRVQASEASDLLAAIDRVCRQILTFLRGAAFLSFSCYEADPSVLVPNSDVLTRNLVDLVSAKKSVIHQIDTRGTKSTTLGVLQQSEIRTFSSHTKSSR